MKSAAELVGKGRWLIAPASWGNGLVAGFALVYGATTIELPRAVLGTAAFVAVVAAALAIAISEVLVARHTAVLRGLAGGRLVFDEAHRLRAVDEARAFPGRMATLAFGFWIVCEPVMSLALGLLSATPGRMVLRLCLVGVLFSPLAAIVTGVVVARRAHLLAESLAEGLSPEKVVASLRPSSSSLRTRLALITVALVAIPSVVAIDVTRVQGAQLVLSWLELTSAPDREALLASARLTLVLQAGGLLAFSIAIAAVVAWAGGSVLARPLQQITEEAGAIAEGRSTSPRFIAGDGEIGMVASVFARLKERLHSLVTRLSSASGLVVTAVSQLERASRGSEAGAAEQAAALNQTSATTEELAQSARQIASSASSVQELAQRTLQAAESGLLSAESFRLAIERMRQDNRSIANAVERLTGRVQQIGRIVDVINTVADRSDLLALSAELEGTRAHEVGRGFSLVALEMRRLAENVLESTAEVEELIGEIRAATRQTAEATERARVLTESGTELADEVAQSLTSVAQSARQTSDAVRTISLATQQQQTGTDQLAEAMADILAVTQQSLASSRQLGSANERLQSLSAGLSRVVARFQRQA